MSDTIEFATATFGGFEKKQVLDYIYKVHKEKDEAEAKYKKRLEDVAVAFKALEEKANTADKNSTQLQAEMEELRSHADGNDIIAEKDRQYKQEMLNTIKDLECKISNYEAIIAEMETEKANNNSAAVAAAAATTTDLESVSKEKAELEIEKERIKESSLQIGRVILDAHNKADTIILEAEKTAQSILEQAKSTIEDQRLKSNQIILDHQENVEKETSEKIASAQRKAQEEITQAELHTKNMVEEITSTANKTNTYLENLRVQVEALNKATETALKNMQKIATDELKIKTPDFSVFDDNITNNSQPVPPVQEINTPQQATQEQPDTIPLQKEAEDNTPNIPIHPISNDNL